MPAIPTIKLSEILSNKSPKILTTATGQYEDGQLPPDQALALLSILTVEQPKKVIEIGTYFGHTTMLMASNLIGSEIHTVDLPLDSTDTALTKGDEHLIARRVVGREFAGKSTPSTITQHFGDSAVMDMDFAEGADFFFIDGSHTYEYAKSDTIRCMACASAGATLLWHDCDAGHPDVVQALQEFRAMGYDIKRIDGTPIAYLPFTKLLC